MALQQNFYTEIFEKEQNWIELIKSKLLNSVYCKYTLQTFYLEKKRDLEQEYLLTQNEIVGKIIIIIDSIIEQIELFIEQFNAGQPTDISSLLPLFLTTQMSNSLEKEDNKSPIRQEINGLQIKKQLLESQVRNFDRTGSNNEDYVYDDFPEEVEKTK